MSGLGNVFDAAQVPADAPRGPDLRADVEVPRSALGRAEGVQVEVPIRLECEGRLVERARGPDAVGTGVVLHLGASLLDGATLRLRGQGGVHPEGAPGDLWLTVRIVDDPPRLRDRSAVPWIVAIAIVTAAVALWALT